jgi:hypothetical protein
MPFDSVLSSADAQFDLRRSTAINGGQAAAAHTKVCALGSPISSASASIRHIYDRHKITANKKDESRIATKN